MGRPSAFDLGPFSVVERFVEEETAPGPLWLGAAREGLRVGEPLLVRRIQRGRAHHRAIAASARWAIDLDHPGLMPMVDVRSHEEEVLLFTAFAEEVRLDEVLRRAAVGRRPLPPPVVARILIDLCEVAAHLHELRREDELVRAAFRPDLVWIDGAGRARLFEATIQDLVARLAPWDQTPKRARYDAPECFSGVMAPPADIWALGVLGWEMLRNRPLFAGADIATLAHRVATTEVRRADAFTPTGGVPIPTSLADVIARCLRGRASRRFAHVGELAAALREESPAARADVAHFVALTVGARRTEVRRRIDATLAEIARHPSARLTPVAPIVPMVVPSLDVAISSGSPVIVTSSSAAASPPEERSDDASEDAGRLAMVPVASERADDMASDPKGPRADEAPDGEAQLEEARLDRASPDHDASRSRSDEASAGDVLAEGAAHDVEEGEEVVVVPLLGLRPRWWWLVAAGVGAAAAWLWWRPAAEATTAASQSGSLRAPPASTLEPGGEALRVAAPTKPSERRPPGWDSMDGADGEGQTAPVTSDPTASAPEDRASAEPPPPPPPASSPRVIAPRWRGPRPRPKYTPGGI
ncbi:MAG: protein kinase [Myxococcota bacterium]